MKLLLAFEFVFFKTLTMLKFLENTENGQFMHDIYWFDQMGSKVFFKA